jgi:hypothetical protein
MRLTILILGTLAFLTGCASTPGATGAAIATRHTATGDIRKNPSITIAGEILYLAYVESGDGDIILNEYIRPNESLDKWNVLFAVRYNKTAKDVGEVAGRWISYVGQVKTPGKT